MWLNLKLRPPETDKLFFERFLSKSIAFCWHLQIGKTEWNRQLFKIQSDRDKERRIIGNGFFEREIVRHQIATAAPAGSHLTFELLPFMESRAKSVSYDYCNQVSAIKNRPSPFPVQFVSPLEACCEWFHVAVHESCNRHRFVQKSLRSIPARRQQ